MSPLNFNSTLNCGIYSLASVLSSIPKGQDKKEFKVFDDLATKVKSVKKKYTVPLFEVYLWKNTATVDLEYDKKAKQSVIFLDNSMGTIGKKKQFGNLFSEGRNSEYPHVLVSFFFYYGTSEEFDMSQRKILTLGSLFACPCQDGVFIYHMSSSSHVLTGEHLRSFAFEPVYIEQLPVLPLIISFLRCYIRSIYEDLPIVAARCMNVNEKPYQLSHLGFENIEGVPSVLKAMIDKRMISEIDSLGPSFCELKKGVTRFNFSGEVTQGLLKSQKHNIFIGKFTTTPKVILQEGQRVIPLRKKLFQVVVSFINSDFTDSMTKDQALKMIHASPANKLITLVLQNKVQKILWQQEFPEHNNTLRRVTHSGHFIGDIVMDYCFYCFMIKHEDCIVTLVEVTSHLLRAKLETPHFWIHNRDVNIPDQVTDIGENNWEPSLHYEFLMLADEATNVDIKMCFPISHMDHFVIVVRRWINNKLCFFLADSEDWGYEEGIPEQILFLFGSTPLWPLGTTAWWHRVPNIKQSEAECGARSFVHGVTMLLSDDPQNSLLVLQNWPTKKNKSVLHSDCRSWLFQILKNKEFIIPDSFSVLGLPKLSNVNVLDPDYKLDITLDEEAYEKLFQNVRQAEFESEFVKFPKKDKTPDQTVDESCQRPNIIELSQNIAPDKTADLSKLSQEANAASVNLLEMSEEMESVTRLESEYTRGSTGLGHSGNIFNPNERMIVEPDTEMESIVPADNKDTGASTGLENLFNITNPNETMNVEPGVEMASIVQAERNDTGGSTEKGSLGDISNSSERMILEPDESSEKLLEMGNEMESYVTTENEETSGCIVSELLGDISNPNRSMIVEPDNASAKLVEMSKEMESVRTNGEDTNECDATEHMGDISNLDDMMIVEPSIATDTFHLIDEQIWTVEKPKATYYGPCSCNPRLSTDLCCMDESCLLFASCEECTETCPAGTLCQNKRIQNKKWKKVEVFEAGKKGKGLKLLEPVRKNEFVVEYVGEVFHGNDLSKRLEQCTGRHIYIATLGNNLFIDASTMGGLSRYINHSCDPNCRMDKWSVDGITHLVVVSLRDIHIGEELTFDYNWSDELTSIYPTDCFCGSGEKCRRFIQRTELSRENITNPFSVDIPSFEVNDQSMQEMTLLNGVSEINNSFSDMMTLDGDETSVSNVSSRPENKELFKYPLEVAENEDLLDLIRSLTVHWNLNLHSSKDSLTRLHDRISVTERDRDSVGKNTLLTDNIVNFWMRFIQELFFNDRVAFSIYSSTFAKVLLDRGVEAVSNYYMRHFKRVSSNIFDTKVLLFPFCRNQHWSLYAVLNLCSITAQIIEEKRSDNDVYMLHLDSASIGSHHCTIELFRVWLNFEVKKQFNVTCDFFDETNCPCWECTVPTQKNGIDCGLFVCKYAIIMNELKDIFNDKKGFDKNLLRFPEFKFSQLEVSEFRQKVKTLVDVYDKFNIDGSILTLRYAEDVFEHNPKKVIAARIGGKTLAFARKQLQGRKKQRQTTNEIATLSSKVASTQLEGFARETLKGKKKKQILDAVVPSPSKVAPTRLEEVFECNVCHQPLIKGYSCNVCKKFCHEKCVYFTNSDTGERDNVCFLCHKTESRFKETAVYSKVREKKRSPYHILLTVTGVAILEDKNRKHVIVASGDEVETLPYKFGQDVLDYFKEETDNMKMCQNNKNYHSPSEELRIFLHEMGRCLTIRKLNEALRDCERFENTYIKYNIELPDTRRNVDRTLVDLKEKAVSQTPIAWITLTCDKKIAYSPIAPLYYLMRWRINTLRTAAEGVSCEFDEMMNKAKRRINQWVKIDSGSSEDVNNSSRPLLQSTDSNVLQSTNSNVLQSTDPNILYKQPMSMPISYRYQPLGENSCVFNSVINALHYIKDFKGRDLLIQELPQSMSIKAYGEYSSNRTSFAAHVVNLLGFYRIEKLKNFNVLTNRSMWPTLCVLKGTDKGTNHAISVVENYIFESNSKTAMELNLENLDWCCRTPSDDTIKFESVESAYRFTKVKPKPADLLRQPYQQNLSILTMIRVMQYIQDSKGVNALSISTFSPDNTVFDFIRDTLRNEVNYTVSVVNYFGEVEEFGKHSNEPLMLLINGVNTLQYVVVGVVNSRIFYADLPQSLFLSDDNLKKCVKWPAGTFTSEQKLSLVKGYRFVKCLSTKRKRKSKKY